MKYAHFNPKHRESGWIVLGAVLLAMAITTGCGGSTAVSSNPGQVAAQVHIGHNAPVERVLSFELAVNSVHLTTSDGSMLSVLGGPVTVEQSHLVGSSEIAAQVNLPQGTYTAADFSIGNAKVVFVDNFGNIVQQDLPGTSTAHVVLNPAVTVGSSPSIVSIGLDIPSFLSFDAATGTMSRSQPIFDLSQLDPANPTTEQTVDAQLEPIVGKVTAVNGSSFTVTDILSGFSTSLSTDESTTFTGVTLGTSDDMLVQVEAMSLADASLRAKRVNLLGSGSGSAVLGTLTDGSGTSVAAQQVYGGGATASMPGSLVAVDMSHISAFQMDSTGMDLTSLTLTFDATNLVAGQRMEFISSSAMQSDPGDKAGLVLADIAELKQQTFSGTVTNLAVDGSGNTTFDLALPLDSSSSLSLLGESPAFVHVLTQPLTSVTPNASLTPGMSVQIRGLLLYDSAVQPGFSANSARGYITAPPPTSNYYMVARSITQ